MADLEPDSLPSLLAARDKEMDSVRRGYVFLIEDHKRIIEWLLSERNRRMEEIAAQWLEKTRPLMEAQDKAMIAAARDKAGWVEGMPE
jgi:hypothetical protein